MLRVIAIVALFLTAMPAAHAEPGAEGSVTAYDLDGRTVIESKLCFKTGRYGGYDYSRCASRLRDTLKWKLCRERGSGTHPYTYQLGAGRPIRSSVYCSRRY